MGGGGTSASSTNDICFAWLRYTLLNNGIAIEWSFLIWRMEVEKKGVLSEHVH